MQGSDSGGQRTKNEERKGTSRAEGAEMNVRFKIHDLIKKIMYTTFH